MINIKSIQNKYGFQFKNSLGQNFFNNDSMLEEILDNLHITRDDIIIEIGPGFGVLTEKLLNRAKEVISIEIDDRVIPILKEELKQFKNFTLIHKDFMKLDLEQFNHLENIKIIANIPYYITTPILEKLFKSCINIDLIAIMMQKEVGERILADKSTKEYGSLSVFAKYFSNPYLVKNIPASNFIPKPKVDSVVIKFEILKHREFKNSFLEDKFLDFVKKCFSMRRKNLYNVLFQFVKDKSLLKEISNDLNIDFNNRSENLTLHEFECIFINLSKSNYI